MLKLSLGGLIMISVSDLRNGMTVEYENNIYQVLEYQHVKSARSAAFVRLKLRNIRNGSIADLTLSPTDKLRPARIDKVTMQYLYSTGDFYVFMNNDTYEQIEIATSNLENEVKFLYEGLQVTIIMYNGEIIGIELPEKITMRVVECEPAVKGDTATNATKQAVTETGLKVQVPLFIEQDDAIIVSYPDGKYVSRAK